ncbi:MAG: molybdopterin-binding protein [Rhodobacteraceae bacterium]|nr:molybdopterin-binding protein [Paracoccaceae bacterium]
MTGFDRVVAVDWSGGNDRGPVPKRDAIWICEARGGVAGTPAYMRNRQVAEAWLTQAIDDALTAGETIMIGLDFPFGYPAGFARALTGDADPLALWAWYAERVEDAPQANNRFDLAGRINRALGDGRGPFWGNGLPGRDIEGLPRRKTGYANPFAERRAVENLAKGSFTCWQMAGAGAVGGQVFMGLPVLERLRRRFAGRVAVWPFERPGLPVALVEIWPSLNMPQVPEGWIRDAWQVHCVAGWLSGLPADRLGALLDVDAPDEGWILGVAAPHPEPPRLANDCFALPAGVDWTPVDEALHTLRGRLHPVTGTETVALADAPGRVLAADLRARRSNPPQANTAVDGFGFAGGVPEGAHVRRLADGRAAAGAPFHGTVPPGQALRVLTGAALPAGVDTVILQEDVSVGSGRIAFRGPLKTGANTRLAGEDVHAGAVVLPAGRWIMPADLALMAATGLDRAAVHERLRVAVMSTGDELVEPGAPAGEGRIHDANRPMLMAVLGRWGFDAVDMGCCPDDRAVLRARLDAAAARADVIVTSGGASAGDEDHVSALLRDAGALQHWRIAIKPGRPLALGLWRDTPVFGLPGNPVAAMVCTLIFGRPALCALAGMGWAEPQGFDLPAAFEKRKKPGRREYLRARIRDGRAEVFASEGSGRISGLSWAEGLVEIGDGARHIRPGDPVRFLPYGSFGL